MTELSNIELLKKADATFAELRSRINNSEDATECIECLKQMATISQHVTFLLAVCISSANFFS